MDLTVTEKDGQPLFREASFVAHFRQKDPVEFISVSSPHAVKNVEVYTNVPDGPDLVFKELEVVSEGVSEEIQEIYKYMVPSSEKLPPDLLQGVEDHVADDECDSWTCFVDSVTEDVMETADRLYDEVMAKKLQWHSHSDKPDDTNRHPGETKAEMPNSPQDEEPAQQGQASQGDRQEDRFEVLSNPTANRKMKPITSTDDSTSSMAIVSSPTPTARFMPSLVSTNVLMLFDP